jgi:methanogenic corrinoid protein MtbC1
MVVWCAYCQRFNGERPPFDDNLITHGMCARCAALPAESLSARVAGIQPVVELTHDLWELGLRGRVDGLAALMHRAEALHVSSTELLVGIVTPQLAALGKDWERGAVTIADEHRFTAFAETVVHRIRAGTPALEQHLAADRPQLLLVNCDGNSHTLGLRIAELWLAERGISTHVVVPGLPADDVLGLVDKLSPSAVGISVSMPAQIPQLKLLLSRLEQSPVRRPVLVGGYAVKSGAVTVPDVGGASLVPQLEDVARHLPHCASTSLDVIDSIATR